MMGAALGAFEAKIIPMGDTSEWALISMAAVMGGTMRSPLTAMLFALELTHDLNLLPGLLAGCIAAHGVTVLMLRRSILTEKVARRGFHVMREYSVDPLNITRVGEVMDTDVITIPASMKLGELAKRIAERDPGLANRQGLPIIDDNDQLVGIITRGDVLRSLEEGADESTPVLEAGSSDLIVAFPDELLREAVNKMIRNNIGRLPVTDRADPRRVIGYLGRANLVAARSRQLDEEDVRERGMR
jgi:CBS domain-containing protein